MNHLLNHSQVNTDRKSRTLRNHLTNTLWSLSIRNVEGTACKYTVQNITAQFNEACRTNVDFSILSKEGNTGSRSRTGTLSFLAPDFESVRLPISPSRHTRSFKYDNLTPSTYSSKPGSNYRKMFLDGRPQPCMHCRRSDTEMNLRHARPQSSPAQEHSKASKGFS